MDLKVKKTEWDLSPLLKGDDDPSILKKRNEIEVKTREFIDKWKNRDDYLKNPEILKEALDEYEFLMANYGHGGKEEFYFYLRATQDENSPKIKAKNNLISEFSKKIGNDLLFFTLKIAKIPEQEQKKFLEFLGLKKYKHFLERKFLEEKYLLNEGEEKILSLKSGPAYDNWIKMISGFLSKEEREILTEEGKIKKKNYSEIISLLNNTNKKVRDSAAESFNYILKKYEEIAEAEINSVFQDKKIEDELRKTKRPDFLRHLSDDISSEIVDIMIDSVQKRFDLSRKYYQLKAKLMGIKKLEYHERNVPYGKIDKKYNYEDSVNLIHNVFFNLDKRFAEIFKDFIEKGKIDVFPRKGKRQGAFCTNYAISMPTYVLLNHSENLSDVRIIAHEMGHAINSELIKEKQNALNAGTLLSTAEVASTFMEDFVLEELEKEADDELKLAIYMMKLNNDVSTIFRQVACYKFEQELHKFFREKGYLSKEEIGKIFKKNMEAYMGDFVEQSEGSEKWWIYWDHIRNYFYVYSYASGLLISKALQASVRKDPKFIEKVKEFLSAGTSDSPKNIFAKLGIDISKRDFWEKGIGETEKLLNETEELAKKLGKI